MKQLVSLGKIAACAAMVCGFAAVGRAADWTFDGSTSPKTITDGTSVLKVSVADTTNLTLTSGHTTVGEELDFSGKVTDAGGTEYYIVGIANSAFSGKTNIKKVVYPDTLRTIGGEAFKGCSSLSVVLPALCPDFITSFNASNRGVYENCSSITQDFVIGYAQPITTGGGQWIRSTKIKKVKFGPYIKTIPGYCWEATSSITDMTFSEGLETINGGSAELGSLTNLVNAFPSTLKTLNQSFRGSSKLKLPFMNLDSVTTLGGNFSGTSIYKIWFGPNIVKFPDNLFERGIGVTNITICATNAITSIGTSAFADMGAVQEMTFMGPAQTDSVLSTIFANVKDLYPIVYVSKRQGGWTSLNGLIQSIDDVRTELGSKAVDYVHIYGRDDFLGLYKTSNNKRVWMINKKSIYDPDTPEVMKMISIFVEPIGVAAVNPVVGGYACMGGDVVPMTAPQWGTDGDACYKCRGWVLEHLYHGVWVQDNAGTDIAFDLTVPDDENETYRFRWIYTEYENAVLLDLRHTGTELVEKSEEPIISSGYKHWYEKDTEVTLTAHDNTGVPKSTFQNWLVNGAKVTGSTYTWDGAADVAVSTVYVRDWLYANGKITDGDNVLNVTATGTDLKITGASSVGDTLDFTAPITDADGNPYSVVEIGYNALAGKTSLKKVVFPDTLRIIGGQAFSGCTSLELVLPALVPDFITKFNESGRGAYEGCSSITQDFVIGYYPITTGGGQWFSGTSVEKAKFGPYIKSIPDYCFERGSLKDLTLSEGLEYFGGGQSCGSLTNVVNAFPSTMTRFDPWIRSSYLYLDEVRLEGVKTLNGNFYLTHVYKMWLGPDVTKIPAYFFQGGNGITNLTICSTNAITSIGDMALDDMGAMQEFTFMGPAQTTTVLNRFFNRVTDLKPIVYASRNQGGWQDLEGLITDKTAVEEILRSKGKDPADYEHIYKHRFIGLYPVGTTGKYVWIVHRKSIYDPVTGMKLLLR